METFSYHSEQIHSLFQSGKGHTQRNLVTIQNGKGRKAVETYSADGKQLNRTEKELTAKELECIKKSEFIPGLFRDCIQPLKPIQPRKKSKTRRARNK
jgi:hypothetical protein